ncbi:MAG: c-type heme family protein [Methylocella sp.]
MLDDLFKNVMVLIDSHYVKKPSDFPAATAAKALWAALKKDGWYDVRILGLTDVIGDPDDVPRDAFEQTAAKKLLAGEASYEAVVETGGKRYLRVATGIPVVSENCLMCHANFKGNKGNIGALAYTVPVLE